MTRTVSLSVSVLIGAFLLCGAEAPAHAQDRQAFHNDSTWPDTDGQHINAHGGGVTFHDGRYYWFGEHKSPDTNSAQVGVRVYSSGDLYNWENEGVALAVSDDPDSEIVRGSIIERPKVIHNDSSGQFVMWFHLELKGEGYSSARTGVAVSDNVTGPYKYLRSYRPNAGHWPIDFPETYKTGPDADEFDEWFTDRWWRAFERGLYVRRDFEEGQMSRDMNLFVDDDGTAYHIHSSEQNRTLHISELSGDYTSFTGRYARVLVGEANEAPAVWKEDGKYWMIASGLSGWDPNAARSAVADSILGDWTMLGNPARGTNPDNGLGPEKTFGAQSTDVFRVRGKEDAYIAMFDVWRPENPISGSYIWLPVRIEDGQPIVRYREPWDLSVFEDATAAED